MLPPNDSANRSNVSEAKCCSIAVPRRTFLSLTGLGLTNAFLPFDAAAGPLDTADFEKLIPADKKFKQDWLDSLTARGEPETFSGDDLKFIGMPIGGIGTGTVYLGGNGPLWLWDVFNQVEEGIHGSSSKASKLIGREVLPRDGLNYAEPLDPFFPILFQGFGIRLKNEKQILIGIDGDGYRSVKFTGQYPIGTVTYQDPKNSISAKLEAFSPFIPQHADDSGLPATILSFTLTNTSGEKVEGILEGWLTNAISRNTETCVERRIDFVKEKGYTYASFIGKKCDPADEDVRTEKTDERPKDDDVEKQPSFGTMTLALLGIPADVMRVNPNQNALSSPNGDPVGIIGRSFILAPGESTTINYIIAWHFPNLIIEGKLKGRYYASKFKSAGEVTKYVVENFERLTKTTKLWRDTWYNSTLPHWFLNRTFANVSTLATSTCTRLADGRFWAWEGVGCGPGTSTNVWHYAQAMGRLFPELERNVREKVDYGLAFDAKSGVIATRGEFDNQFTIEGQCGTILRAYREHLMSANSEFLERNWAKIKLSLKYVINLDKDRTGLLAGSPTGIVSLYHAALRAGEEMAKDSRDKEFARECRNIFDKGLLALDKLAWRETHGYYIHVGEPQQITEMGLYEGCHIDQVLGQSWAFQLGLGRVMDEKHTKQALESIWKFSVAPDVGPFREVNKPGRWFAMPGEGGTLMVTFPYGRPAEMADAKHAASSAYFNECWTGCEWQLAAHLLWEGMVTQGLAVARLVHDRYHPRLRNPYNEIEHGDHSARAMASYGAFLAACGFEYHGPHGHIGFAPRLTPDDFAAAFTAAEGWGTFSQTRGNGTLTATLSLKYGKLMLKNIALELPEKVKSGMVEVKAADKAIAATIVQTNQRIVVTFAESLHLNAGQEAVIQVDYM